MRPEEIILDSEKVLARFDKWPGLHDTEIVSVHMDRSGPDAPWIEFALFVWDYTGRIAPEGYYEQTMHSLIRLRCERVSSSQFDNFNHQNVLFELGFSRIENGGAPAIQVGLDSSYGLGGTVTCERVRVVDVVPATPRGEAMAQEAS